MVKTLLLGGAMLLATSTMAQDAPEALYIVGAFTNWETPDNGGGLPLKDLTGDGTYVGVFDVEKDKASFKIFTSQEGNWLDPSTYFGCENGLDNFVWSNQPLSITCSHETQSDITIPYWEGGSMEVMVTNIGDGDWRVTVMGPDQPVYPGFDPVATLWMGYSDPAYSPDGFNVSRPMTRTGFQTFEDNYYFNGDDQSPLMVNFWSGNISDRHFYGPENADETLTPELGEVQSFKGVDCDNFWKTAENWPGGRMKVTADLNTMEFTFEKVEDCIYLIGSPQGWNINSDAMKLPEIDGMGNYEATFTMTEDQDSPIFRFYTQLGDWETGSWGSQVDDVPIDLPLEAETTTEWVWGKGSWQLHGVKGCSLTFKVNYYDRTLTVINNDYDNSSVNVVNVSEDKAIYFDLMGRRIAEPKKGIYLRQRNGKVTKILR